MKSINLRAIIIIVQNERRNEAQIFDFCSSVGTVYLWQTKVRFSPLVRRRKARRPFAESS